MQECTETAEKEDEGRRESKEMYKKRLESELQENNIRDVGSGLKYITGFKGNREQNDGNLDRDNELNMFFNSFSSEQPA